MDRNDRSDSMVQTNIKRSASLPPVNQQHDELVRFIHESWSRILSTPGTKGPIFYNVLNQNSAVGKTKVHNFHNKF
uniref:CSON002499 protein n=1 Tax=Culicoides sonorensis TaxID=179676 RepID=A0A336M596_CULSO